MIYNKTMIRSRLRVLSYSPSFLNAQYLKLNAQCSMLKAQSSMLESTLRRERRKNLDVFGRLIFPAGAHHILH